jgi:hypothetical protein
MRAMIVGCCLMLAGCASVEQETIVSTPIARPMVAGVGDEVLRAEGRESMPNAFGNADVFGRTRSTGFTTIQYGGLQGNKVVLLRGGVATQSDATSMNSTGTYVPVRQESTTTGPNNVRTTTTTTATRYVPPTGSTSVSSQQPTIPILVDWRTNPRVPVLGKTIVIESASATSLNYRVE